MASSNDVPLAHLILLSPVHGFFHRRVYGPVQQFVLEQTKQGVRTRERFFLPSRAEESFDGASYVPTAIVTEIFTEDYPTGYMVVGPDAEHSYLVDVPRPLIDSFRSAGIPFRRFDE